MGRGQLQYTMPSLLDLLSVDDSTNLDGAWCRVHVLAVNDGGAQTECKCTSSNCIITYTDDATAGFIRVLPQAVFFNTRTTFFVDTQYASAYREVGEEMPFRMGFIDNSNTNYEIWLDEDDEFSTFSIVEISGQSGDAPVNATSIPRLNFHVGDAWINEDSMKTCSYDNSDCYLVRSIAVINAVEFSQGNTNGGQLLKLEGFRFNGQTSHSIQVAGVTCAIDEDLTTKEVAICETGAATAASEEGQYVGSVGLRREIYRSTSAFSLDDIAGNVDLYEEKTELLTSFEFPNEAADEGVYSASIISGWFLPPHSSGDEEYIFHVTCSNTCHLYLSETDMAPGDMAKIAWADYAAAKGEYYEADRTDQLSSNTLTLTAGVYHYIELRQTDNAGTGYAQVVLEVVNSPVSGHQNSGRETQHLSFFAQDAVYDTIQITIDNPKDDVTWSIEFINPNDDEYYEDYETVDGFPSAAQCKQAVADFYWAAHKSGVTATQVQYDINGDVTTVTADTVKIVCTITMTRLITGYSATYASPVVNRPDGDDGTWAITVTKASVYAANNGLTYDAPFSGSFKIVVPVFQQDGVTSTYTDDIDYNAGEYTIKKAIWKVAPEWINRVDVILDWNF